MAYRNNLLRLLPENGVNLGRISDSDGTVYQVSEIVFHHDSEHTLQNHHFPMELQVIYRAVSGTMRQKAVLSLLYEYEPGENIPGFEEMDLINLPTIGN